MERFDQILKTEKWKAEGMEELCLLGSAHYHFKVLHTQKM